MPYVLSDPASERAVLAGICRYGYDVYVEVADILSTDAFNVETNQAIFKCAKQIIERDECKSIDLASLYAAGHELGFDHLFDKKEENKHINSILSLPVNKENVRKFAAKIRKLQIGRLLHDQLEQAQDKLLSINGNETITHILGIAEDSIFDFSSCLNDGENEPKLLLADAEEYLKYLAENRVEQVGISTGYPVYDKSIGGGLRPGVSIVGARLKTGKSVLCLNVGIHIAEKLNIPVLYMDTEMSHDEQRHRIMARMSDIEIDDIETGKFADDNQKHKNLLSKVKAAKNIPFYHKEIAGMPFEDQLAIMRRWLVKTVGVDKDGKAKPCVILYDYLKLMTSENITNDLKEYQILGFMMTSLHNFTRRYGVPIFSTIQLNRDGISKESTDVISGSDRIGMFCNNFSIYKRKSDEEIAEDGPKYGNRKLVPLVARHGRCMEEGDYINMLWNGPTAKIVEGKTKFEIKYKNEHRTNEGFVVTEDELTPFE